MKQMAIRYGLAVESNRFVSELKAYDYRSLPTGIPLAILLLATPLSAA